MIDGILVIGTIVKHKRDNRICGQILGHSVFNNGIHAELYYLVQMNKAVADALGMAYHDHLVTMIAMQDQDVETVDKEDFYKWYNEGIKDYVPSDDLAGRIDKAIDMGAEFGTCDGAHHKMWVIDQMIRILLGDNYSAFVASFDPDYAWEEGIAP